MKIKVFNGITNPDTEKKVNDFLASVDPIDNGIFLKDNSVSILYNDKSDAEGLSVEHQTLAIRDQLRKAQAELIGFFLERDFWDFKTKFPIAGDNTKEAEAGVKDSSRKIKNHEFQIRNMKDSLKMLAKGESLV